MQGRAAEDLRRLVTEGLKAQGLEAGEAKAFATPRRLTLVVEGVPAKSPDISEERKGPRVNAPEQAIAGFVKSAGLKSIKEADSRQGREEGRLLRRQGREARPGGEGDRGRGGAGRGGEVSVAQVDALGLRPHAVGAAAALDRLPARRQGGAVRHRGRGERQGNARASLSRQRAVRGGRRGRLRQRPQEAQGDPRRGRARGADRRAGACAGEGAQAGAGRGRGAAQRERRADRVADGADGHFRRGVPRRAGRMPDDCR